jgi:hypothetical protein
VLLGRQRQLRTQLKEQAAQRQNLTGGTIRLSCHSQQLRGIEHVRYSLRGLTANGGMPLEEVRQSRHQEGRSTFALRAFSIPSTSSATGAMSL